MFSVYFLAWADEESVQYFALKLQQEAQRCGFDPVKDGEDGYLSHMIKVEIKDLKWPWWRENLCVSFLL